MGLVGERRDMGVQGELHAALDAPVRLHTRNDDLGLANAVDSALPLADEAPRLLRQTGAKRQQKGKDGPGRSVQQDISPGRTPIALKSGISAAPQPTAG